MKIRQKQQGFTLIELMITLVLSLLVTYGIAQVLISSNRSATTSDGVSQAQETARFVMSFLGNHIRDSGLDSIDDDDVNTRAVIGCDIAALNAIGACAFENNIGATEANISITAADVAAGGSVALSGDRLALAWIPPAGVTTDCTGTTIAGFAANMVIVNVFWVSLDPAANSNSLICQGTLFDGNNVIGSSVPQAIANGVEAFQVLYGEATSALPIDRERNVSHYVNANEVTDWERVFAVKIAIMTRSINDVTNLISRKQYTMLDAGLYNLNDAVNYQVFTSTFAISNFQD